LKDLKAMGSDRIVNSTQLQGRGGQSMQYGSYYRL
jgi:hypothetical protein